MGICGGSWWSMFFGMVISGSNGRNCLIGGDNLGGNEWSSECYGSGYWIGSGGN